MSDDGMGKRAPCVLWVSDAAFALASALTKRPSCLSVFFILVNKVNENIYHELGKNPSAPWRCNHRAAPSPAEGAPYLILFALKLTQRPHGLSTLVTSRLKHRLGHPSRADHSS